MVEKDSNSPHHCLLVTFDSRLNAEHVSVSVIFIHSLYLLLSYMSVLVDISKQQCQNWTCILSEFIIVFQDSFVMSFWQDSM